MKHYGWAFILLIVMVMLFCKSKEKTGTPPTPPEGESSTENLSDIKPAEVIADDAGSNRFSYPTTDSLVIRIEKTPCYGTCPVFQVSIYQGGYVLYEGKEFTDKKGKHYTFIEKEKLNEIIDFARAIKYFDMKGEYDCNATDLPSVIFYIANQGRKKQIISRCNAPEELKQLDKLIMHHLEALKWKYMQDKRQDK